MKAAYAKGGVAECRRLLEKKLNEWKTVPLNVAVIGDSGVGKSSFINSIRGLTAEDEGSAAVDVTQATMMPRSYPHPDNPKLTLWDLPGVGTPHFPKETYLTKIDVDRYDFFLLMTATRITGIDTWLGSEIRKRKKNYFFVRTKVDIDVSSDKKAHPSTHTEEAVLNRIRDEITEVLRANECEDIPRFLIDNYMINNFDFKKLEQELIKSFPQLKKNALIFSLQSGSEQMIKLKVAELKSRILKMAALSAGVGAYPIPGVSFVTDIAIVISEAKFYYKQLGLDSESLRRYAKLYSADYDKMQSVVDGEIDITAVFTFQGMRALVGLLAAAAPLALAQVSEEVAKFIPVVGSLLGVPLSFGGTYFALTLIVKKFEEVAIKVIQCAEESAASVAAASDAVQVTSGSEDANTTERNEDAENTGDAARPE